MLQNLHFYVLDIDECAEDQTLCTGDKQSCKNVDGDYHCKCEDKYLYEGESKTCIPKPKGELLYTVKHLDVVVL